MSEGYAELRTFLVSLDEPHRMYALAYSEQLSMGEPAPSSAGLNRDLVGEIRRRMWLEWRRRIDAMPGSSSSSRSSP